MNFNEIPETFSILFLEKEFDPPFLANDETKFEKFDFRKVEFMQNVNSNSDIRNLIYNLTVNLNDKIEKIASIFYWVSLIDKENAKFPNEIADSLEYRFNKILKNDCWQPNVFEFLCRCIGVTCNTIQGIVRTLDYIPDGFTTDISPNHTWNSVCINNTWYLCDILWSLQVKIQTYSGALLPFTSHSSDEKYFTNQYFLMPPIIFRTTHFPIQESLQLLSETITYEQFESYPIFTIHFFNSPLVNLNYSSYSMISEKGFFKLILPYCGNSLFHHFLEYFDEQKKEMIKETENNQSIKSFSVCEVTKENIVMYFRFPLIGNYFLTIFCQNESEETSSLMKFKALLKWKIVCKVTNPSINQFFGCQDMNLGPNWPLMEYYGLVPINLTTGIVKIDYSPPAYIEICFTKLIAEVAVIAKIRGSTSLLPNNYVQDSTNSLLNSQCNGQCLDWLIDEDDDTETEIIFTVRLPKYGEYSFEIYANLPKEGDTFVHVAQYIFDLKENKLDNISTTR